MRQESFIDFIKTEVVQICQGGRAAWFHKVARVLRFYPTLPLLILAIPVVVVIRLIRPWLLVRWGSLHSDRIGHFSANTELYLCEQDAGINKPIKRHVDIFFNGRPVCNQQLAKMWKRVLRIWPVWIRNPVTRANWLIPGGTVHEIYGPTEHDRDVHNLLERFPTHLRFTAEEEYRGEASLRGLGVPEGAGYVCFHARDSAYLDEVLKAGSPTGNWRFNDYLDTSVQNYVPAADELTGRGYFAIRMGSVVKEALSTSNQRIIDYATTGRTDFLDIYIGAKCQFILGAPTGYLAVPTCFRRPVVLVNVVTLEYMVTWWPNYLVIPKKLWLRKERRFLAFREILESGLGRLQDSAGYEERGIDVIENTPEEITAVVVEMDERLKGNWRTTEEDEELQQRFWTLFKPSSLHGVISARIGTEFLRQNRDLLE